MVLQEFTAQVGDKFMYTTPHIYTKLDRDTPLTSFEEQNFFFFFSWQLRMRHIVIFLWLLWWFWGVSPQNPSNQIVYRVRSHWHNKARRHNCGITIHKPNKSCPETCQTPKSWLIGAHSAWIVWRLFHRISNNTIQTSSEFFFFLIFF